jgi:hypothetical protein
MSDDDDDDEQIHMRNTASSIVSQIDTNIAKPVFTRASFARQLTL